MATFEMWDKDSRSVVGAFATEAEALAAVRAALERHGRPYAETFAVIREDARGESTLLGEGGELVDRACRAAATPPETRAS